MSAVPDARALLHRPIRPRAGRIVSFVLAAIWAAVFTGAAFGFPPVPDRGTADSIASLLLAAAGAFFLYRLGAVAVLPAEDHVVVRNIARSTRMDWAEVVDVRFDSNSTWGRLDLADGTSLNTLGIQTADGAHARRDAVRLATLVELHSRRAGEPPQE